MSEQQNPYEPPASIEQSKVETQSRGRVSMGQKIAFGIGMLANQMFPAALGVFFVLLVDGLGFHPFLWGVIYFLPRLFDAITDPIMGFISDNTRSSWGRRRQYVFIGAIILGISYIGMWQMYPENGKVFNFFYFVSWSFLFYLGLTIFSVPYVAMGYEMSDDFKERTNIMAVAQFIGQWAWVIVPWFWVILYDPAWFSEISPETGELVAAPAKGARILSVWVAIPCTLMAMTPAFFVKSTSTVDRTDFVPINFASIFGSLKAIFVSTKKAFAIPQFRKLAFATFLVFNCFNITTQFTFFIVKYYLFDGGDFGLWPTLHGCVGALLTTFMVIPLVAVMANFLGKKKTFIISQLISVVGYVLFWFLFIPGKPWAFLIALPFHSFGIGGLFTLMMSMTADVCDLDELETGERREGMLGAVYWWMVKFGNAFAFLLSGIILTLVGFEESDVKASALTGMRVFYTLIPILGVLGAIGIMWTYDISEKEAENVRQQLAERKKQNEQS